MVEDRDASLFLGAMGDVEPLDGDDADRVPARRRSQATRAPSRPLPRFQVWTEGEQVEGLASGVDRRKLRRLRRGPVDRRIDLHGMTAEVARQEVLESLEDGRARGERHLLIIHGKGRGSAGLPVLKEGTVRWLVGEPMARWVIAFCSAPPELGGAGATLVLLRPPSRRRPKG